MAHEIDFIGVSNEEAAQDAATIAFRWKDLDGTYKVGVFDGGLQAHGQALSKHLNKYYFADPDGSKPASQKIIDCVFVSHPHQDHTVGLQEILEKFTVRTLYMNCPWEYACELSALVEDKRVTLHSLIQRLHEEYSHISKLEEIALRKGIPIKPAFQGCTIENTFTVLSPSKEFYLKLLAESPKTPKTETSPFVSSSLQFSNQKKTTTESWEYELLRDTVETEPDNETSIVLFGRFATENMLLTGDAGVRALTEAMDYADSAGIQLSKEINFLQVPHHGGRHNVGPKVLDRLLGPILPENSPKTKTAFVSVAAGTDHPRQMVVNAFVRRGAAVYATKGYTIWHHDGTPAREGWGSISALPFNPKVEAWED